MASTDACAGCGHARGNHVGSGIQHGLCIVPGCKQCLGFRLDFGTTEIPQAEVIKLPPMCEPCSAAWSRWLDYEMPPAPIQLITIDNTVRGIRDRQQRRADDYYATIRFQQSLIRKQCAEGSHARPKTA